MTVVITKKRKIDKTQSTKQKLDRHHLKPFLKKRRVFSFKGLSEMIQYFFGNFFWHYFAVVVPFKINCEK